MVSSRQWARSFTVKSPDIDYLMNLLLERETPLSTQDLALALIEHKLQKEAEAVQAEFKDARLYDPAKSFEVGQKVVFPALEFATAQVAGIREGDNTEYGDYNVIQVQFENDDAQREFASGLGVEHKLNINEDDEAALLPGAIDFTAQDVLEEGYEDIIGQLEKNLVESQSLAYVAKKWFPIDLMIEADEGHRHLAEAVLDINGGGPMTTSEILTEIGGLGDGKQALQVFSMNYALNEDERFDEVGPAGEVLWFLTRLEPPEVRTTPEPLIYHHFDYDRSALTLDMLNLEREIDDELSEIETDEAVQETTVTLIYPHRRIGTLPLNSKTKGIFPTARRAPRIWVTLVDGQDGEEFNGWVVHREGYVYGLAEFYRKHRMPIGSYLTVKKSNEPGKIIVDLEAYRPRTEYIPLITVKGDQPNFENTKRAIGAEYDDLMILGVDDLASVEALSATIKKQRRTLASIMKMLIPSLGNLTPQSTVHVKTIYSAVNVFRRVPPGPIMVMLNSNPDFENVGGHYWKLSD